MPDLEARLQESHLVIKILSRVVEEQQKLIIDMVELHPASETKLQYELKARLAQEKLRSWKDSYFSRIEH